MSGISSPALIAGGERLARFVLFSKWIRSSGPTKTVKPDAFIPHPYPDLSVTRHLHLSEKQLWDIGQAIADVRPAYLYGRADIQATHAENVGLRVKAAPVRGNANHANVTGWPGDKPAQKIIAQQLAAVATYCDKGAS